MKNEPTVCRLLYLPWPEPIKNQVTKEHQGTSTNQGINYRIIRASLSNGCTEHSHQTLTKLIESCI